MEEMVKGTAFQEFDEGEKTLYAIVVDKVSDEGVVEQLTIRWARYPRWPHGNRYGDEVTIVFALPTLRIVWREFAYEWGGTFVRGLAEVTMKTDFQELPWWSDFGNLELDVRQHGVRQAIKWIIDYLHDLAQDLIPKFDQ